MIGEVDLFGVFFPAVLPLAVVALVSSLIMRVILRRAGFYRLIWHAGLFDTALYLITLCAFVLATRSVAP
jgi:protein AaeX